MFFKQTTPRIECLNMANTLPDINTCRLLILFFFLLFRAPFRTHVRPRVAQAMWKYVIISFAVIVAVFCRYGNGAGLVMALLRS